jgi:hypothetical protein
MLTTVVAVARGDNVDFAEGKPGSQIPLSTCLGVFAMSLREDKVETRFDT